MFKSGAKMGEQKAYPYIFIKIFNMSEASRIYNQGQAHDFRDIRC